jgi:hypothetical protein
MQGDDSGLRAFSSPSVQNAWKRLLSDRESLVWRHVATARGLLSDAVPELGDAIHRDLDPRLTPTEWRRAAASLAARIALHPSSALSQARSVLAGEVLQKDPGVSGAMVFGLPRAAEVEPEAAEELLVQLVERGGLDAAAALVDVRRERLREGYGAAASALAREHIRRMLARGKLRDDGQVALLEALDTELAPE